MKKLIITLIVCLLASLALCSCKKDSDSERKGMQQNTIVGEGASLSDAIERQERLNSEDAESEVGDLSGEADLDNTGSTIRDVDMDNP